MRAIGIAALTSLCAALAGCGGHRIVVLSGQDVGIVNAAAAGGARFGLVMLKSRPQTCAGDCTVGVLVTEALHGCTGDVDVDVVDVRPGGSTGGRSFIVKLPRGYKFVDSNTQPAIFVKDGSRDPFAGPPAIDSSGQEARVKLKGARTGTLVEYGIRFFRTDGSACAPIDPWIVD